MKREVTIQKQAISIVLFMAVLFCGLLLPMINNKSEYSLPIESIMFISASIISLFIVVTTNKTWEEVFESGLDGVKGALPGLIILLVIGSLIAGFIMSGLMPMLVYYGVKLINPRFVYATALILSALFSSFTGTSWGSAATIGVVMMGVGNAIGANNAIIAGAIVGGAYFGDKMSPLSDTTNIAAIASKVNLYDHVASMLWTTGPATIIALVIYIACGFIFPATNTNLNSPEITRLLADLSGMFNFNIILFIPLLIVLVGSAMKKPAIPVMTIAAFLSLAFAVIFQGFSLADVLIGLNSGFSLDMVTWHEYAKPIEGQAYILGFFQKGGFWELGKLLPISTSILFVVGVLGSIDAMPATVNVIFGWVKSRTAIICSSLLTGIAMIAMTANGIACSFVTAGIFGDKYDENNIDRRVLSRTTEDTGTLLEVLFPWTPAAIFFTQTLGVNVGEYALWSIVNWGTPIIAVILAVTGIGTYKNSKDKKQSNKVS
ncbi:TPA: sodium:proton antiporter [Clostridioides difficile]|nr:sodium:proton antiporter [Clostridioides difficile]MCD8684712.1 sodium:proton antiporter [Clostridioides difficile]HBF5865147.1 sodium:proton antiporter [Clostridioides difficile]HBG2812362.1 sodium:proton antiporter [Clostridioides difficile]HBH1911520.1 sodium:proton antiporter [Clostridioides difficile]